MNTLETGNIDEVICDHFPMVQRIKKEWDAGDKVVYYHRNENILSRLSLDKHLASLFKKVVWLDNGANIVIEEKEAFTVIDVNTAKFSGRVDTDDFIRITNRLAAREIARQLRLRDIGGNIFIDFINMQSQSGREELLREFKKELEKDHERTIIYGFTKLGVLEMSRKRTKPSVQKKMSVPCAVCQGTGFVESPATVAFQLERELWEYKNGDYSNVVVAVTEDVLSYFTGENKKHLLNLENTLKFTISFEKLSFPKPHYYIKRLYAE